MKRSHAWVGIVFALVLGSSFFAYGALGGSTGVRIPYNGTLDRDGVPLSGDVALTFAVFNAAAGGSACYTSAPIATTVTSGKFAVVVGPVTEACVKNRDIFLQVTVNDGSGDVALPGRQQVYPAVAATTAGTGDFDVPGTLSVGGALSAGTTTVGALTVGGNMNVAFSYGNFDTCYYATCPSGTQLFAPDVIAPKVTCASGTVGNVSRTAGGWYADCAPGGGCATSIKTVCTRILAP
jgi:hypothetical protein